jgi:hypothetical protein
MLTVLRSSEFWMGLFVTMLQYLISAGVVPAQVLGADVQTLVVAGLTYILGRLFGKTARAVLAAKS